LKYIFIVKVVGLSKMELARVEIERVREELEQLYRRIDSIARMLHSGDASLPEGPEVEDLPEEKIAELFSPLAHVERVKILKVLSDGGKYFTELMDETGLSHSPLYFHLNVLQKSWYVTQEFTRGRYLITPLGSEALKAACRLYKISETRR